MYVLSLCWVFLAAQAFLCWWQVGAAPVTVPRLLVVVASLAVSLGHVGFRSCSSWALEHRPNSCGTWV